MLQPASAVALGLFDGVHIGHRAVLAAAVACQADGLTPAAFTMRPLLSASNGVNRSAISIRTTPNSSF